MDQGTRPRATDDPAINAILARVASLSEQELVQLARRYEATRLDDGDGIDRRRVLQIARDRAQRGDQVRRLEVAVATALHDRLGPEMAEVLRRPWASVA